MSLRGDILRRLGELVGPENIVADSTLLPASAEQVAAVLALANAEKLRVAPAGNGSQYPPDLRVEPPGSASVPPVRAGSAVEQQYRRDADATIVISLRRMNALKQYEPADLTASMQAGITLEAFSAALEPHRQWLPLGAPLPSRSTMGGIVAANTSGPFRQFYGTARDMVIGLRFATVEGRLIKSGGMVVKNVAGYDMAKLLIGSMGTLGVITDVNVRTFPRPATETTLLAFDSLEAALECRNAIVKSVLAPMALDLLDRTSLGLSGVPPLRAPFVLAVEYGGVEAVIERNRKELATLGRAAGALESLALAGGNEPAFWRGVCDLPARFAESWPGGMRMKVSSTLGAMAPLLQGLSGQAGGQVSIVARAGCGITYLYANGGDLKAFCGAMRELAASLGAHAVIKRAPSMLFSQLERWGPRRDDYLVMLKLKQAFDPNAILNPGVFVC